MYVVYYVRFIVFLKTSIPDVFWLMQHRGSAGLVGAEHGCGFVGGGGASDGDHREESGEEECFWGIHGE